MGVKSQGRGTVAALGLFLLFAGLVGGGVLYVVAQRRPAQSVEGFARAPVGCTTTLEFTESGTFYVFEEAGVGDDVVVGDCQPVADPSADFSVAFSGDLVPAAVRDDDSVSYDVDGFDGRSVQRIDVAEVGQYTVAVVGDDLTVVAALGRDPDDGVDELQRLAMIVAIAGIGLGIVLLVLAGRRSKKAASFATPDGPGWEPAPPTGTLGGDGEWPPKAPRLDDVPITTPEPAESPTVSAPGVAAPPALWQPPSGEATGDLPPPADVVPDEPALPDRPDGPSGA